MSSDLCADSLPRGQVVIPFGFSAARGRLRRLVQCTRCHWVRVQWSNPAPAKALRKWSSLDENALGFLGISLKGVSHGDSWQNSVTRQIKSSRTSTIYAIVHATPSPKQNRRMVQKWS